MEYNKIFDFDLRSAKKLYNSSYLEELTGLMEKVAYCIGSGHPYCFDNEYYLDNPKEEPNSSFKEFIKDFKNSFEFSSSDRICIIRGRAGVGKTLFFDNGVQMLVRKRGEHREKYIQLGIDFKNIDGKKDVEYYTNFILNNLRDNAVDAIRQMGENTYNDFLKGYKRYCRVLDNTPFAKMYPAMFFCKLIYNKYNKPCIIILDNIDLACVETQKNVFKATAIVCERLYKFMGTQNAQNTYRIYFAMRPETHLRSEEAKLGNVINFPLPNIQAICLKILEEVIVNIANDFDKKGSLKCEVTYYSVIDNQEIVAKTYSDIATYFIKILNYYLKNIWNRPDVQKRLGTSQEFHCNLVNYNVRTFLSFLTDTLANGGFKPLTQDFNKSSYSRFYSVFDYIEMIIRGRWLMHPGNKHIDSEGGNKAPIVFNVFDSSLYGSVRNEQANHLMLNVHVLQYFDLREVGAKVRYGEIEQHLSVFYDSKYVKKAVQELTYVRILYSFFEGDENIASKQSCEEVVIEKNTQLCLSPTGRFYLEKFIYEFEYLYQMALSTFMPTKYVEELSNCWQSEKELTVLRFLMGLYSILNSNLERFDETQLLGFKQIFCQGEESYQKPFSNMLDSFISVLSIKIQQAEIKEIRSLEKLCNIREQANLLKEESVKYFTDKLGCVI